MFSCEFCEVSNHTFFTEHLQTTASVLLNFTYFSGVSNVELDDLEQVNVCWTITFSKLLFKEYLYEP